MSKRAERRHHAERLRAKRKNYLGGNNDDKRLGKLVHTATACSCYMCGNPRRHFNERTIQEKRHEQ